MGWNPSPAVVVSCSEVVILNSVVVVRVVVITEAVVGVTVVVVSASVVVFSIFVRKFGRVRKRSRPSRSFFLRKFVRKLLLQTKK